jgi:single-stranded-DNA-specific exonuclease
VQRGLGVVERAKWYLRPSLDQLHDPGVLAGMAEAVERIALAVRTGEHILIHGDYDVDGICSTTILLRTVRALGGRATPFIPRRLEDGYDLTVAGVRAAAAAGASLLVTCDCGTNALEAVGAACGAGVDVIVSDHHLPSGALPRCVAVVNPRRPDCGYPDKDLCGAGLAFKVALALAKVLGVNDGFVYRMLDLVALATIADVAPLRGENRVLVRYGLRVLEDTRNVGLQALVRAAGLEGKAFTAGRVGFMLAPRLNAVGRLGHALRGVELLMTEDGREADGIARELEEVNRLRQDLDRTTFEGALRLLDGVDLAETYAVVLAERGWHPGVIGIVASRVVEQVCRPTVLIALSGEEGKGSGRSIPGFDLHAGLGACRDLLVRFGGHRSAAGLTIAASRVAAFAEQFNEVAKERLGTDDLVPAVRIDLELPLAAATGELEALLHHFEPFGVGNAAPVFLARRVRLAAPPRVVGRGHLKLRLAQDGAELDAVGWGMGVLADGLDVGSVVDVAFRLERTEWHGERRVQATLSGLRR